MADVLNFGAQFSMPTVPSEPGVGRKGWKVVLEVLVVLLLASLLIGWFAMVRNQSATSSLLPSKEQLLKKMSERPAVSLTNIEKQSLLNAMIDPAPAKTVGKTAAPVSEPSVSLTDAQRADLLKKMTEGK